MRKFTHFVLAVAATACVVCATACEGDDATEEASPGADAADAASDSLDEEHPDIEDEPLVDAPEVPGEEDIADEPIEDVVDAPPADVNPDAADSGEDATDARRDADDVGTDVAVDSTDTDISSSVLPPGGGDLRVATSIRFGTLESTAPLRLGSGFDPINNRVVDTDSCVVSAGEPREDAPPGETTLTFDVVRSYSEELERTSASLALQFSTVGQRYRLAGAYGVSEFEESDALTMSLTIETVGARRALTDVELNPRFLAGVVSDDGEVTTDIGRLYAAYQTAVSQCTNDIITSVTESRWIRVYFTIDASSVERTRYMSLAAYARYGGFSGSGSFNDFVRSAGGFDRLRISAEGAGYDLASVVEALETIESGDYLRGVREVIEANTDTSRTTTEVTITPLESLFAPAVEYALTATAVGLLDLLSSIPSAIQQAVDDYHTFSDVRLRIATSLEVASAIPGSLCEAEEAENRAALAEVDAHLRAIEDLAFECTQSTEAFARCEYDPTDPPEWIRPRRVLIDTVDAGRTGNFTPLEIGVSGNHARTLLVEDLEVPVVGARTGPRTSSDVLDLLVTVEPGGREYLDFMLVNRFTGNSVNCCTRGNWNDSSLGVTAFVDIELVVGDRIIETVAEWDGATLILRNMDVFALEQARVDEGGRLNLRLTGVERPLPDVAALYSACDDGACVARPRVPQESQTRYFWQASDAEELGCE